MNSLLLVTLFAVSAISDGSNWPQFRGPHGNGHADSQSVPVHWSETENIAWKTPIHGRGWSSPVVWGGKIWLSTASEDGSEMFAIGLNAKNGKILHT